MKAKRDQLRNHEEKCHGAICNKLFYLLDVDIEESKKHDLPSFQINQKIISVKPVRLRISRHLHKDIDFRVFFR